jgi:hypothetical protein
MKKMIFAGFAAFLAFSFAACEMTPSGADGDNTKSVIYDLKNGRVTLRIDGGGGG